MALISMHAEECGCSAQTKQNCTTSRIAQTCLLHTPSDFRMFLTGARNRSSNFKDFKSKYLNPRGAVSDALRNDCMLVQQDGHKWIWDFRCCVDRTSKTDLQDAINPMYALYENASMCYALRSCSTSSPSTLPTRGV